MNQAVSILGPAPAPGKQTFRLAPVAKFYPSPPACGGRGRGPARRRWEGEVGGAAVRNEGLPPPRPDPLCRRGGRGRNFGRPSSRKIRSYSSSGVLGGFPR